MTGHMHSTGVLALAATAAVAVLASGCGAQTSSPARAVAGDFAQALSADNGREACRLLAPETRSQLVKSAGQPCASAILEEELPAPGPVEGSSSFGTMAEVSFAMDTIFVTELPHGWRVMAAGCAPVPGRPYDCQLQGG
jgi:hypothetical protein